MGMPDSALVFHQPLTLSQIADLRLAASNMTGAKRRAFEAEMTLKYCEGAYSTEFCHLFRRKVATQSTGKLPPPIGAERRGVVYG